MARSKKSGAVFRGGTARKSDSTPSPVEGGAELVVVREGVTLQVPADGGTARAPHSEAEGSGRQCDRGTEDCGGS